ncbi:WAT1-related protein At3g28050-like [Mangifera indica]|uniref:WAT1-related protein At3g28050-like n=1 Tax=Mangifera indica TaxID=29780 RepID=UPI001CF9D803|nr:WAT1-related protein At3g28050-like [Mangifera indica]
MALCSRRAVLPFLGMVTVIFIQVSNMEVIKAAISKGTDKYVLIVYSQILCTLIFVLCSLIFHRSECPPMSFSILCKLLLLSVSGVLAQICAFVGIQYSSPMLSTALLNLIPAFTFLLAVIFRMEKVKWMSTSSQAKSLGTIVSIAGAFVVTFYRGPPIIKKFSHLSVLSLDSFLSPQYSSWILGGIFLAADAFLISAWYILQAITFRRFPSVLIIVAYQSFFTAIMSTLLSLILVKDPNAWKLGLDIGLIAIFYSAIIGSGLRVCLVTWCLSSIGPLYVSMFKPLAIVFSIVMDIIFLGEPLCLGSLIGAVIIVTGFYFVKWGNLIEENTIEDREVESSILSSQKVPLLKNKTENI